LTVTAIHLASYHCRTIACRAFGSVHAGKCRSIAGEEIELSEQVQRCVEVQSDWVCTEKLENRRAIKACWIPVAPGAPSDVSKSMEVWPTKTNIISVTYEIRTESAKSRGLEKDSRGESILGLGGRAAVQSFVRECPCLLGIFARSQASGECWPRRGWRSESVSNRRYGSKQKKAASKASAYFAAAELDRPFKK
jgi:hypothetical protein